MYINSLKAINIAIEAIKQLPPSDQNEQAVKRLENMKKDKYIHWTKEMVFRQLDEWKKEHNRNPRTTNLAEPNMPKASTIQKLFDMNASAFLNMYYPSDKKKKPISKYAMQTEEEWEKCFVNQFNMIKPKSAREYDIKRDKSTPNYMTIARHLGVTNWTELILRTKVDVKCLQVKGIYQNKTYTVDSTSSLYNKLEKLLNEKNC